MVKIEEGQAGIRGQDGRNEGMPARASKKQNSTKLKMERKKETRKQQ